MRTNPMSWLCGGAAKTSIGKPVPAWNKAMRWATGKPHPGLAFFDCPKCFCNSGVSGIEKLDPSTKRVRCPRGYPESFSGYCNDLWLIDDG